MTEKTDKVELYPDQNRVKTISSRNLFYLFDRHLSKTGGKMGYEFYFLSQTLLFFLT